MNKNIKKINSHLWLVNFEYMDAGYIKEMRGVTLHDGYKALTSEGIILLNAQYDETNQLAKLYHFAMGLTNKQLQPNQAFKHYISIINKNDILKWNDDAVETYVAVHHLENIRQWMNNISISELDRRHFKKKYRRKKPIRMIKKLLERS